MLLDTMHYFSEQSIRQIKHTTFLSLEFVKSNTHIKPKDVLSLGFEQ